MREPVIHVANQAPPPNGIPRTEALAAFIDWFQTSSDDGKVKKSLEIIGKEHSGKTFFARQVRVTYCAKVGQSTRKGDGACVEEATNTLERATNSVDGKDG